MLDWLLPAGNLNRRAARVVLQSSLAEFLSVEG